MACASARQRNIASGSAIYPSLPPSVILAYDLRWEELMFVAPPPFSVLYHRLYRVSQIDDSIRPTKPTTTLHIFRFRCLINLYMFIYFVLLVIVMIYFVSS